MTIKKLFDPSKNINRSIEKVITYGVSQEARLKSEISEYVVTDSIDQQFENLLLKMEAAMDIGGENEVGVWVSGFYGSGKSSFTKYLGLAFDDRITIDGVPFIQHLQDRLKRQQTKSLLSNVRAIFEQDASPSFAVVDAIGGGLGWPNLRALLAVESARDILFALLVPNDAQQKALKGSDSWVTEARDLLRNSMGLSLKTRGKTWDSVANELWRFVLFSEFVFDLPGALPLPATSWYRATGCAAKVAAPATAIFASRSPHRVAPICRA